VRDLGARCRKHFAAGSKAGVGQYQRLPDGVRCQCRVVSDPVRQPGRCRQRVRAVTGQQLVDHAAKHHLQRCTPKASRAQSTKGVTSKGTPLIPSVAEASPTALAT